MLQERKFFYLGSIAMLTGIFSVTVIPIIIDNFLHTIVLSPSQYRTISLVFFAIGAFAYTLSYSFYKKQLIWFAILLIYYLIFQLTFEFIKNLLALI